MIQAQAHGEWLKICERGSEVAWARTMLCLACNQEETYDKHTGRVHRCLCYTPAIAVEPQLEAVIVMDASAARCPAVCNYFNKVLGACTMYSP
jgi:hypothetical protein